MAKKNQFLSSPLLTYLLRYLSNGHKTWNLNFSNHLNFYSLDTLLLDQTASFDLREAEGFFLKDTFLKSEISNEKDEVCLSFLVNIFTKTLLTGGVWALVNVL